MTKSDQNRPNRSVSHAAVRQKALIAAIRAAIAGGVFVQPAAAEPLPVPLRVEDPTRNIADFGNVNASINAAGNKMTINQLTNRAIIEWKSFDIDAGHAVQFRQPNAASVALNNIRDSDPSQIFGSLSANGQIYLFNQNGFVFGKSSQVNASALVATTLGITDDAFKRGITKVFDQTKEAALKGDGEVFLKDEKGDYILDQNQQKVPVRIYVQEGATITGAKNAKGAVEAGNRVILAAPVVDNEGTIKTPEGQTILAAAQDKVYLQEANGDPNLRGLLVEVGTGGDVKNVGKVLADRGNASLIGFAVNQEGMVSATSSVSLNGSVRLLAREGLLTVTGSGGRDTIIGASNVRGDASDRQHATVKLGGNSVTQVLPDADKSATAVEAQDQPKSKIEIEGHRVFARGGAVVRATSGTIDITAKNLEAVDSLDGRIYLEKGSVVDASGLRNVEVAMERNVLEVELRKNELRDSPLQRDGILYAKTVKVDLRDVDKNGRIPIADVSGAVNRIRSNIDERSTKGGTVNLKADGDTIVKAGATIDVSGGSVAYRSGTITTTRLMADGKSYDIGNADAKLKYTGLADQRRFEKGYVEAKDGGSLKISGNAVLLDGSLKGSTVRGPHQRGAYDLGFETNPANQAKGSDLSIRSANDIVVDRLKVATTMTERDLFPTAGGQAAPLVLGSDALSGSGFRNVDLASGKVTITRGSRVELPVTGSLTVEAGSVNVEGDIVASSGSVTVKPNASAGSFHLGSGASIDVRGLWVNDKLASVRGSAPLAIDGGKVTIATRNAGLVLEKGSRILADGGARLDPKGKVTAGKGGDISLVAQADLATGLQNLVLDGDLSSYGISRGGTLTVRSPEVVIGDDPAAVAALTDSPLLLKPNFFRSGGFSKFDVGSDWYGLTVAPNTQLLPSMLNRILTVDAAATPSAANIAGLSEVGSLPDAVRKPVDLVLSALQPALTLVDQVLTVGEDVRIKTEPGGSVTLNSDTSIHMNGRIRTGGGDIALKVNPVQRNGYFASQGIWLGANSALDASGVYQPEPNVLGLRQGEVLDGGDISLTAARGYIVAEQGSRIESDGSSAVLDLPQALGSVKTAPKAVDSDGGRISLAAAEGLFLDGSLSAQGGGRKGAGGELAVSLNHSLRLKIAAGNRQGDAKPFPDDDPSRITDETVLPLPRIIHLTGAGATTVHTPVQQGDDIPDELYGSAWLSAPQVTSGGFASVKLQSNQSADNDVKVGEIRFHGDVNLFAERQIVLDAPRLGWVAETGQERGQVAMQAAYVAMGSSLDREGPEASAGNGRIDVTAKGIELIGGLSLQGVGHLGLDSSGDLRVRGIRRFDTEKDYLGELNLAGDLTLRADQIYPATLSHYTIDAGDGSVTIAGTGEKRAPVYSAGGSLGIEADEIHQNGVVKAPFGQLTLNADDLLQLGKGSITSVSGAGTLVPFGRVQGGIDWVFPLGTDGSRMLVFGQLPAKKITLGGQRVELSEGSKVNLNGGGNLTAYEWIKGPGGSVDVLDPASEGFQPKFAVVPGYNSLMTAYDPSEFDASGLQVGDRVYLAGGSDLAAGWYTLLPAHYALLPGAYLVTPQGGTTDIAPGQAFGNPEGATVVAGRYGAAGTNIADNRWTGFDVEKGTVAKTRAEYNLFQANQFYADKGVRAGQTIPNQPRDAGDLALSAAASLSLAGDVQTVAYGRGAGGRMDIQSDRLAVIADPSQLQEGVVGILASDLNALNVSSILLGGERTRQTGGSRLTVGASSVTVAEGARLKNGEVILAATERVTVESGAVVESSGSGGSTDSLKVINAADGSDGALLRVSSAGQAVVSRDQAVSEETGVLDIAQGSQLKSAGSILLDSTQDTLLAGELAMNGGSLALHAGKISLGDVPAGKSGLVLSNEQLAGLNVNELEMTSRSDLNLYGAIDLQTKAPASGASGITIDAATIKGHGEGSSRFAADHVSLINSGAIADSKDPATGTGSLELRAGRDLVLGSGNYAIGGFDRVVLRSEGAIKGLGRTSDGSLADSGNLKVDADLELAATAITGGHGATTAIDAVGHVLTLTKLAGDGGSAGLGVSWSLDADSIQGSANFDLHSGILQLRARQGDVNLADGTEVDVTGRAIQLGPVTRYSDAGAVLLQADRGNVSLAEHSTLKLDGKDELKAGDESGDAGRLSLLASQGRVDWNGTVTAHAGEASKQGSLKVDARDFGGFSALNGKLKTAGFSESVELRQRQGNVNIAAADEVRAHHFGLTADQGAVTVAGIIDASGGDGGSVAIAGRDGITLAATGLISAKATAAGGDGGSVQLDTVHRDDAGSGMLDLSVASSAGKGIDVSAGSGGDHGEVHLRTGRDAAGTVSHRDHAVNTRITGVDQVALEATRVYASGEKIDADDIQAWKDDTAAFMAAAPAVASASAPVALMPGVEARSASDLDLAADWDLVSWRYGESGTPGILTLKAAGDLDLHGSLSDGFAPGTIGSTSVEVQNLLQPGNSWSYNLVAGNDVNLLPNIQVRTGTGDITLEAGGDVTIKEEKTTGDRAAVIYTMGRPSDGSADAQYRDRRYGNLHDQIVASKFYAEYPIDGGDIAIRAGGNVVRDTNMKVPPVQQLITDWLVRAGSWTADGTGIATMWGINVGDGAGRSFHQDVGALGGGDVTVTAGGDVRDLSVVIPTTGKPVGATTVSGSGPRLDQTFQSNNPEDQFVQGGGNLAVTAGKDILGGFYYAEKGTGTLIAGGSIGTGYLGGAAKSDGSDGYDGSGMGPVLAMGDARFRLNARRDLTLAAAFNPGLLAQDTLSSMNGGNQSFAITYGAESSVELQAVAGDLALQNRFADLAEATASSDIDSDKLAMSIYPGTLKGMALEGDVEVPNDFSMMPANQGQLELLAGSDLRFGTEAGSSATVNMSDTDPSLLPSLQLPAIRLDTDTGLDGRFGADSGKVDLLHAAIPVHLANPADSSTRRDSTPVRLVAATGDLALFGGSSKIYLPKVSEIYAGRDIVNLNLHSQNLNEDDITRIEAGRDIIYPTSRNADTGALDKQGGTIELGGPGELQLVAGRDIDLGASDGVRTLGGLLNSALADLPGADVSALAGFRLKDGGFDGFIEAYIESGKYGIPVLDENGEPLKDENGRPVLMRGQAALDHLAELSDKAKLQKLLPIMYREVAKAANAAARSGRKEDYQPGYDAIGALFDTQAAKGDIKMFFSQIKTGAGGDINLAAPGGLINAGLAGSVAGAKGADQLGVVVAREGDLNAVTDGDFLVNESRVFTMGGGDILIWSSHSDIDAGRGAKSAISAPAPTTTIDALGNVRIEFPPAVSGSGIQAIASGGKGAGKVILAAPAGVVNAGEAGITGGQVVIAATAVIGASNIQSTSGPSIGVPTAVAPPVVPAGADSAATSATKSATSMEPGGDQKTADAEERGKQAQVSILSADVVGYGNCSVTEVREGKEDCGGTGG